MAQHGNRYSVRRGSVHWECQQCRAPLTAPLADADSTDTCPQCGAAFIVPGRFEKELAESKKAAADAAAEAERRSKQRAEAEKARQLREAVAAANQRWEASKERRQRSTPRTEGLALLGVVCFIIGILLLIAGITRDTSVSVGIGERVHNIGLVAAKISLLVGGALAFLCGGIMVGLARLGDEVNRWGSAILDRLEQDSPRRPIAADDDADRAGPTDPPAATG